MSCRLIEKLDLPPYNFWAMLCRCMKGSGISTDTLSLDMTNAFAGGEAASGRLNFAT